MKCYLCSSNANKFIEKNGYGIFVCPRCSLKMTDLKKSYEQFLSEFYTKGYFIGEKEFGAYENYKNDKPFISRNMRSYLSEIKKYKKNGRLLDVGCAMGYFVELAMREGFDAYGFDTSEYAISNANPSLKNRVRVGTIGAITFPKKSFDVITLFDVVEHLHDPLRDILRLKDLLKDDGILVFATGNCESVTARILKRRWTFYTPPQHLFFFNHNTFGVLMKKASCTVVKIKTTGKWLSLGYVLNLARSNAESALGDVLHTIVSILHLSRIPMYLAMRDNMFVVVKKDLVTR